MRGKKIFGSQRSEKEKTWQADAGRSHTRSLNGRVEPAVAFHPEATRVAAVKREKGEKKNRKPTKNQHSAKISAHICELTGVAHVSN